MKLSTAAETQSAEVGKRDSYRLIVFNRSGTAVMLKTGTLGYELPLVNIPKFTRPAKEITKLLRDRWYIPSVLLFSGPLETTPDTIYFAALDSGVRTCSFPRETDWFPVHLPVSHLLSDKNNAFLHPTNLPPPTTIPLPVPPSL